MMRYRLQFCGVFDCCLCSFCRTMKLDRQSGAGFGSNNKFMFGQINMKIKVTHKMKKQTTISFWPQYFISARKVVLCVFLLNQVANLRQRFFQSIAPGGLAGDRHAVVPGSGFSFSAQHI